MSAHDDAPPPRTRERKQEAREQRIARIRRLKKRFEEARATTLEADGVVVWYSAFLEWAIRSKHDGFKKDEKLTIGDLAAGLETSRTTIGEVLRALQAAGWIRQGRGRSASTIINNSAPMPGRRYTTDSPISITRTLQDQYAGDLAAPLIKSSDASGLKELGFSGAYAARLPELGLDDFDVERFDKRRPEDPWVFERLRFVTVAENARTVGRVWWMESTFLLLPDAIAQALAKRVLESRYRTHLSFYDLLESSGLTGPHGSRSIVSPLADSKLAVSRKARITKRIGPAADALRVRDSGPWLRWDFAHFAKEPAGLFGWTVCLTDPEVFRLDVIDFAFVAQEPGSASSAGATDRGRP